MDEGAPAVAVRPDVVTVVHAPAAPVQVCRDTADDHAVAVTLAAVFLPVLVTPDVRGLDVLLDGPSEARSAALVAE